MSEAGAAGGSAKDQVREHWEAETCGTRYGDPSERRRYFESIERTRYEQSPFLKGLARFEDGRGLDVLEIGVGAGTDFHNWVRHGARATGVDLTDAAIALARERLALFGEDPEAVTLTRADAEALPFPADRFDLVYSWGVLHHSPDTERAFAEAYRVLRPGGEFRGMIYHVPSWTGWLLWGAHCLRRGRPWVSPRQAIFSHLESPGTKAYTVDEARALLEGVGFADVSLETRLGNADLLTLAPSARYRGLGFRLATRLYPRRLVRLVGHRFGLNLLIRARKPAG